MKKFTLLLLVLASLFYFAACGGSKKDDSPATDSDTDSVTEPDTDSPTDADSGPEGDDDVADPDADRPDTEPEPDTDYDPGDGCIEIDVPTITSAGYYDEINGFFSPSLGDNTIDIVKIFILDTKPGTAEYDIEPGTYDLGEYPNYTYEQCRQCVMVWVDVALGEPAEAYFQTEGSLTITAVAGSGEATRTDGYIENVKLMKAEFPSFTLIPDATECIRIPYADWSLTSTVAEPDSDVMPDEDSEPAPDPDAASDADPDPDSDTEPVSDIEPDSEAVSDADTVENDNDSEPNE